MKAKRDGRPVETAQFFASLRGIKALLRAAEGGNKRAAFYLIEIAMFATGFVEVLYGGNRQLVKEVVGDNELDQFPVLRSHRRLLTLKREQMVRDLQLGEANIFKPAAGVHADRTFHIIKGLYLVAKFAGEDPIPRGSSLTLYRAVRQIRKLNPLSMATHKDWAIAIADYLRAAYSSQFASDETLLRTSKASRDLALRRRRAMLRLNKKYGSKSQAAKLDPITATKRQVREAKIAGMKITASAVRNGLVEQIGVRLGRMLKK